MENQSGAPASRVATNKSRSKVLFPCCVPQIIWRFMPTRATGRSTDKHMSVLPQRQIAEIRPEHSPRQKPLLFAKYSLRSIPPPAPTQGCKAMPRQRGRVPLDGGQNRSAVSNTRVSEHLLRSSRTATPPPPGRHRQNPRDAPRRSSPKPQQNQTVTSPQCRPH